MFNRSKVLLLGALSICILTFAIGCDQPDDVITPNGRAYLTLTPQRLPNNPAGTVYELWVANDTDTLSLGRFGYDYPSRNFLTDQGVDRPEEGLFFLDEAIDNYNNILVSVEQENDPARNSPASIMLIDFTSSQTIILQLPLIDSLWSATARYNMKSVSDGLGTANDGKSIWFSSFTQKVTDVVDTFSIIEWHLDSGNYIPPNVVLYDTNVRGIDSIITLDTIMVLGSDTLGVGLDTITRTIVRFNSITTIDSSDYFPTGLKITYNTSPFSVTEEKFTQDKFAIPNLQKFGWKYRGWVVSNAITPSAVGNITLPAWTFFDPILTNSGGGLLSTGAFYEITEPDFGNPFIDTLFKNPPRVPLFPGEDFLNNLPAPLNSIPILAGTAGHVFITLEPEFYNDSTNFPLFAFIGGLPRFGSQFSINQGFTLTGYMYTNDPFRGFPTIGITIEQL